MSEIIKVLVLPSDTTGSGKYRSLDPHIYLNNQYPNDFFVDIIFDNVENVSFENYHIIHFHRTLIKGKSIEWQVEKIKSLQSKGVKIVMDVDDYWDIPKTHPNYNNFKQSGHSKNQLSLLRSVDFVTTTTPIFADEIKKVGIKNVIVIENSINPEEPQFKGETKESDLVRIGWLGGSSHGADMSILDGTVNKLNGSLKGKYQMVLCGFDTRGTITEKGPQGIRQRPIKPWETSYFTYEAILTDKYKTIDEQYREHLLKFNRDIPFDDTTKPYRRIWTEPINKYALGYTNFDISLAPLVENTFNSLKSELKVIESGFYKKALIAQDFGPYKISTIHALNQGNIVNNGNALLIPSSKNHKLWFEHIKRLINNPNMIKDLGENLYESVKDKYHLKTTTEKRKDFYKQLIKI